MLHCTKVRIHGSDKTLQILSVKFIATFHNVLVPFLDGLVKVVFDSPGDVVAMLLQVNAEKETPLV